MRCSALEREIGILTVHNVPLRRHGAHSQVSSIKYETRSLLPPLLFGGSLLAIESVTFPSLRSFINIEDRVHYFLAARKLVTEKIE